MTTSTVLLALAVFGACTVESVEALTLVIAAGTTRGWRSAFEGAASALVVLAVLVGAVGVPLIHYVPIDVLRVIIGALLLVLGLGWLRKAVLRASGHKALHDEDAIYQNTVSELAPAASPGSPTGRSAVGFTVAFKGVFLEGMEVVLIVLSLGATSHQLALASTMAAAAAIVVIATGIAVARQLREVPENALKFSVGVMLTSFGLFWVGEGSGLHWPGSDAAILVLIAGFLLLAFGLVRWLSRVTPTPAEESHVEPVQERRMTRFETALHAFGHFWIDLLVGDTPETFFGTAVIVGAALALRHERPVAISLVIVLAIGVLSTSTLRGRWRSPKVSGVKS
jgi:uncharacterized membrane protein